jgi:hypothetical protein
VPSCSIHVLLASSPVPCLLGHSFVPPTRNLIPRPPTRSSSFLLPRMFCETLSSTSHVTLTSLLPSSVLIRDPRSISRTICPALLCPALLSSCVPHCLSWSTNPAIRRCPTRRTASPLASLVRVRTSSMSSECFNSPCAPAHVAPARSVCSHPSVIVCFRN